MAGDVTVAVVSGALTTTSGGATNFTKTSFGTPKACIVLVSFDATDDTSVAAEGKVSIGFSTFGAGENRCITHQDEDAQAKVDCDALKSPNVAYSILDTAAAVDFQGIAQTITDGVKLIHDTGTAPASGFFATVIMFGGADLKVSLDSVTVDSTQNNAITTTTNIDQDLVFFIGTDISQEDSASSGIENSFGVAHINTSDHATFVNRCIGFSSDHNNVAGSPSLTLRNDRCLKILTETGVADWGLELTAATTTSYTTTTRDNGAGAGMEVYALALDLDDRGSKVGSVDSPFSGTSWTPSVSLGFTPQYVGIGLTRTGAENGLDTTALAGSCGISSNTGSGEETCHTWYNDDAAPTINTNNLFRSRVIDLRSDDLAKVSQDHSHSSFNSGGWTYTINSEDETTADKWFYWAIEEAAAAGENTETLTATATGVASIQLAVAKTLAVTAVANAGLSRKCFIPLSATATGVATLTRLYRRILALATTAVGVVTITAINLGRLGFRVTEDNRNRVVETDVERRVTERSTDPITASLCFEVVATGVVNLARKINLGLSDAATGVVAIVTIPTFRQVLTATATGVANLQRKSKIILSNTATGIVTIVVNQIAALAEIALAVTATAIAALQLKTKKTLASTATGIAALVDIPTFVIVLAATATGVITLAKKAKLSLSNTAVGAVALARTAKLGLSVSATGVVDLARKVRITLRNTATGVVSIVVNAIEGAVLLTLVSTATAIAALQITVKKTLGVVSVGVATLDPIATFRLLLTALGTGIATLRTVATFRRAFSAVATGIVALGKKPKLGLAATATGIVSINRTIFKTLRSTAEGVATLVLVSAVFIAIAVAAVGIPAIALKTKRGLNAVSSGVARIQRTVRKTLDAIATGIATLNEERPTPPSRLQRIIIGFFGGPGGGPGR